jgi:hypothetical protein
MTYETVVAQEPAAQGRGIEEEVAMTYETVVELARALPEVEESTSYGTPALKVRGKLFARLREDGETLVLRTDYLERDHLLRLEPKIFHLTDHYLNYPWVLVRLKRVGRARLAELLADAWRRAAPKRLVQQYDAARSRKAPGRRAGKKRTAG